MHNNKRISKNRAKKEDCILTCFEMYKNDLINKILCTFFMVNENAPYVKIIMKIIQAEL